MSLLEDAIAGFVRVSGRQPGEAELRVLAALSASLEAPAGGLAAPHLDGVLKRREGALSARGGPSAARRRRYFRAVAALVERLEDGEEVIRWPRGRVITSPNVTSVPDTGAVSSSNAGPVVLQPA